MHDRRSSTSSGPAMAAGYGRTSRVWCMRKHASPTSAQTMCGMGTTDILLLETGVMASVSLFILLISLHILLLPGLIGLLSLSGLTGLSLSLVGLLKGLSPGAKMGD